MTKRPVHEAFVEERTFGDLNDEAYFVAACLVTHRVCDAYAFVDTNIPGTAWWSRAVSYLGDRSLHSRKSLCFCDAEHVHV